MQTKNYFLIVRIQHSLKADQQITAKQYSYISFAMSSIHHRNLASYLQSEEARSFFDVKLVDKEGNLHPASKIILAAHSKVLEKIFLNEADKTKTTFSLPEVPGLNLSKILNWINGGEFVLSWDDVQDILKTAEYLAITEVSTLCQERFV